MSITRTKCIQKGSNHTSYRYVPLIVPRSVSQQNRTKSFQKSTPVSPKRRNVMTEQKKPPIPSYLPKERRNSTPCVEPKMQEPLLDDPDCISLREQLFEDDNIDDIDTEQLERMREHLREYIPNCMMQRDYENAKRAGELYDYIIEELKYRNEMDIGYVERSMPFEELKRQKEEEFEKELEEYDEKYDQKETELEMKLKEEDENFEKLWVEKLPQKYRKKSGKLLQLLQIEKNCALTDDYQNAPIIRNEVQMLEMEESERAQNQLIRDYELRRAQFDEDQRRQREIFQDTREHWRSVIIARQKVDMEKIDNRGNVMTIKQQQLKKPKESSMDPSYARPPVSRGFVANSKIKQANEGDRLLPPLVPPNDESIHQKKQQVKKKQQERNKEFKKRQEVKAHELDAEPGYQPQRAKSQSSSRPVGQNSSRNTQPKPTTTSPPPETKKPSPQPKKETKKETPKETKKENPKETKKENPKETKKETPKETKKETPKETKKESPKDEDQPAIIKKPKDILKDSLKPMVEELAQVEKKQEEKETPKSGVSADTNESSRSKHSHKSKKSKHKKHSEEKTEDVVSTHNNDDNNTPFDLTQTPTYQTSEKKKA